MALSPTRADIEQALARSDIRRAADLALRAIAAGQEDPMFYNLAAWDREEVGDFAGASALLEKAAALAPGDPLIIAATGASLRRADRLDEALRRLDQALAIQPNLAVAWLERGFCLEAGGSFRLAEDSYRRAAHFDPGCAEAFAGVASIAARNGASEVARQFAAHALTRKPGEAASELVLIGLDIEGGARAGVLARLERFLARGDLDPARRDDALMLMADLLRKMGRVDDAFATYAQVQSRHRIRHADRFGGAQGVPTYLDQLNRIDADFAAADTAHWPLRQDIPVEGQAAGHLFLMGFPRSGTTLVENILASAPGVIALEERPTLAASNKAFLEQGGRFADLCALDGIAARPFVQEYWNKVAACGVDVRGRTLVDMDPLKGSQLPVITRLFPDARIIVMRRDPRDVVWSCFRHAFRMSPATWHFTSLVDTARTYDAMMRLIERCLTTMPVAAHELHYAALVSDFDGETRRLCDFAGVEWTAAMRDFHRTAQQRGVSTNSVTQVRQGLFDGGGQWRPFARHLEPIMPILKPWIDKFGFAD